MEGEEVIVLGEGVLGWTSSERHTDRYGAVHLNCRGKDKEDFSNAPVGVSGKLVAEIVEVRNSFHLGDISRGVGKSEPAPGEIVDLGEGELFTEEMYKGIISIGVKPSDGREHNWLSIEGLFRCHGSVVKLLFTPGE